MSRKEVIMLILFSTLVSVALALTMLLASALVTQWVDGIEL